MNLILFYLYTRILVDGTLGIVVLKDNYWVNLCKPCLIIIHHHNYRVHLHVCVSVSVCKHDKRTMGRGGANVTIFNGFRLLFNKGLNRHNAACGLAFHVQRSR